MSDKYDSYDSEIAKWSDDPEYVKWQLSKKMIAAAEAGDISTVRMALSQGVDVNFVTDQLVSYTRKPLPGCTAEPARQPCQPRERWARTQGFVRRACPLNAHLQSAAAADRAAASVLVDRPPAQSALGC